MRAGPARKENTRRRLGLLNKKANLTVYPNAKRLDAPDEHIDAAGERLEADRS